MIKKEKMFQDNLQRMGKTSRGVSSSLAKDTLRTMAIGCCLSASLFYAPFKGAMSIQGPRCPNITALCDSSFVAAQQRQLYRNSPMNPTHTHSSLVRKCSGGRGALKDY